MNSKVGGTATDSLIYNLKGGITDLDDGRTSLDILSILYLAGSTKISDTFKDDGF